MKLIEVNREDKSLVRRFLELPVKIYKDDPNWVRPLDKDIEFIFDPEKNKFWRHGKAIRWILVDAKGHDIGRVAAFINEKTANKEKQPTGGMGFFECINDQKTADLLFEKCMSWLKEQGMEAMDGPINFGERNNWWGLLIDGFMPPVYQMPYSPPYYQALFENFGFKEYFQQLVFHRKIMEPMTEKFWTKYNMLMKEPGYTFSTIDKSNLDKYTEYFLEIYNKAWAGHGGFAKMRMEQAKNIMKSLKPVLYEELAYFGFYNGEPIAFWVMIPDMNEIFGKFNGRFGLVEKLRTWFMLKRKVSHKCVGIIFGIVPEHQGKGVEGGLAKAGADTLHPMNHWQIMEMNWIGDFNPKMINMVRGIGAEPYKTYVTYRYLFDPNAPFERHPMINVGNQKNKGEHPAEEKEENKN